MKLKDAIDEFILTKEVENLSQKSLSIYRSFLEDFLDFTGNMPVETIRAAHVVKFLGKQRTREGRFGRLSDATIHKYYSVIRTFSIWLDTQGYKEFVVTEKVKAPRMPEELPETLSDEELKKLFRYLKTRCAFRILCIFEFFLDTGARLAEVRRINLDDVHLEDGWVKVYGKGRREAILPLGKNLQLHLHQYLTNHRPYIAKEGEEAFFVTKQGNRYTVSGLSTLVKTKLKKIGVKGQYGAHKLRHTFATRYLINGGDLESLRRIMRHRSVKTTQRYIALVPDDIQRAHKKSSPLDNLMKGM
jgi:site-specific recombinase XerD